MPEQSDGLGGGDGAYREQVDRLVHRLAEVEGLMQSLSDGGIDAVVDPTTSAPILLGDARAAVRHSEARYRDLVNRSPSIVCELAPSGETILVNDAVRVILGHEPADLRGRIWWETLVPHAYADRANALRQRLTIGDVTGYELPACTVDGRIREIAWNSANRYAQDGGLQAVVLFGVDVTPMKEADENARRLAEERVARAEAEAANRAKMDFLAVMSHELRTPLNAIAGYAELLEMGIHGPITPDQERAIRRIRSSQRHLLTLIDDLLNYTRLEAGQLHLELGEVCAREALEATQAVMEPQARSRGLDFRISLPKPSVRVHADRDRTRQVLVNLASNAVKYTPRGGLVELDCEVDSNKVTFHVRDNGPGIAADQLESILEPFVQLRTDSDERPEGVGLGLAISRSLARAMNGELRVTSTVGAGSTFSLLLPRHLPPTP